MEWLGIIVAVTSIVGVLFGIWWRVESKQDGKMDDLKHRFDAHAKTNLEAHESILDRIERIWHHLAKRKDDDAKQD